MNNICIILQGLPCRGKELPPVRIPGKTYAFQWRTDLLRDGKPFAAYAYEVTSESEFDLFIKEMRAVPLYIPGIASIKPAVEVVEVVAREPVQKRKRGRPKKIA